MLGPGAHLTPQSRKRFDRGRVRLTIRTGSGVALWPRSPGRRSAPGKTDAGAWALWATRRRSPETAETAHNPRWVEVLGNVPGETLRPRPGATHDDQEVEAALSRRSPDAQASEVERWGGRYRWSRRSRWPRVGARLGAALPPKRTRAPGLRGRPRRLLPGACVGHSRFAVRQAKHSHCIDFSREVRFFSL